MAENTELQSLTVKQVPAANAWFWIVNGFSIFRAYPAMWIILLLIYLAIMVPLSMLPLIGSLLSTLLAPVFAAGLMHGARAVVHHHDLEINHLFEGFKRNTSQLIAIGGMYMLSLLLVAVVVVMILDKETTELLVQGKDLSPEQADGMLMPMLIGFLLILPVLMAYWFAPVLAGLHQLSATAAMKLSFAACFSNMLPFFLYGIMFTLLLIISILPFGLGLVVVVPLMMTSLYSSYADVFGVEQDIPASPTI